MILATISRAIRVCCICWGGGWLVDDCCIVVGIRAGRRLEAQEVDEDEDED